VLPAGHVGGSSGDRSIGAAEEGRLIEWVVFLHVASAFWFVGGLIGRWLALARARTTANIAMVSELAELAGRF